jgi:hypothetical protein
VVPIKKVSDEPEDYDDAAGRSMSGNGGDASEAEA